MLTKEALKSQELLKELTDSQIEAIAQMSKNDENVVIAQKVREIHDRYDEDFKEVTGLEKPSDKKSYDFIKEEVGAVLKKISKLESKVVDYEGKVKELAEKSPDAALKEKYDAAEDKIKNLSKSIDDIKLSHQNELKKIEMDSFEKDIKSIQEQAISSLTFSDKYDDFALSALREKAIKDVMAKGIPFVIEKDGKKDIAFKDENEATIYDDKNLHEPLTFSNAVRHTLANVLSDNQKRSGLGEKGNPSRATSLGAFATRTEALDAIRTDLAAKGITVGTEDYINKQTELYKEYGVGDLPISTY